VDRGGAFTNYRVPSIRPPLGYGRSGRTAGNAPQAGEGSLLLEAGAAKYNGKLIPSNLLGNRQAKTTQPGAEQH